jgi:ribosomal protein S6--L-glutamate ligase
MIKAVIVRILVLSRKRTLYSTRRLLAAARLAGHSASVVDPMECWLVCGRGAELHARAARGRIDDVDVALPALRRSRDKFRSLQLLEQHGVAIPRTAVVRCAEQIRPALRAVGGLPVVLKLRPGTQGIGVMLAETGEALEAILHTLWSVGQDLLVQELVAESRGCDLRALVVGGRVIAAMQRTAPPGDFRANIHRGGVGRVVQLPADHERVAVEAAQIMGLGVAGVDLLESRAGAKVLEVNASPGFEGLEKATGRDLAAEIIRHAASRVSVRLAAGGSAR